MSLRTRLAFVVAGGLLSLAASARDAEACSPPECRDLFTLPPRAEFPANGVAFRVAVQDVGGAEIVDEGGAKIETHVTTSPVDEGYLFRPKSDLTAGKRYTLRYPDECISWVTGPKPGIVPVMKELPFYVGNAAPAPTTSGSLVVVERAIVNPDTPSFSIVTRLAWNPSTEMAPYYGMASARVEIDGKPYNHYQPIPLQSGGLISIPALCVDRSWEPTTCGDYQDAPQGKHTITVKPSIAGVSPDPAPASLEIVVSCDPKSVLPKTEPVPPTPGPTPLPMPEGDDQHTNGTAGSGGCSVSTTGGSSGSLAALGLALGAMLVTRARRSRKA
jgi:MYXO-CTERM domain-containing protein